MDHFSAGNFKFKNGEAMPCQEDTDTIRLCSTLDNQIRAETAQMLQGTVGLTLLRETKRKEAQVKMGRQNSRAAQPQPGALFMVHTNCGWIWL